jgi:prepilin-type N-terminal cleavage/methylation domain-containing protein
VKKKRGFTLVEVMVVILIVAILAATVSAYMRRRADSAKWTEGRSMMGTIATAIRCYHAEVGESGQPPSSMWNDLGLRPNDFDGTYFDSGDFSFEVTSMNPLAFTVTATHSYLLPSGYILDQNGLFEEVVE